MSGSIIITGASQGIGLATAETFLADGWTVGLLARRAEVLEQICAGNDRARPVGMQMQSGSLSCDEFSPTRKYCSPSK